ncbi:serine hydrolase [Streptomyces sp. TG1A-8]|uniref:serine hydrolase n=1 Tax=Streptomyces sp. TG1A-8 TaxID=3051385 RepID=UPI00265C023C|nr:serine hydrolase [Streptomyces sp. TG1A-8]MDO0924434.1 serine hydrolase [Streptomyces sp. TG1A-8]
MDLLAHLEAYVATADEAGFSRAADRLGIAQPLLSRRIKVLEDHFGGRLSDRSRRQVPTTEFGLFLLPYAQDVLDRAQRLRRAARSARQARPRATGARGTCRAGWSRCWRRDRRARRGAVRCGGRGRGSAAGGTRMNAEAVHRPACVGGDGGLLALAEETARDWADLGVRGAFLARNPDSGEELGFDVDEAVPLASVVKVPLVLAVLDRIATGELDPARPVTVDPATSGVGPTGLAAFRHPATVAVGDLLFLMLSVSDNAAADALFDLVPVADVDARLRAWGCAGIRVRHRMNHMYECAAGAAGDDFSLALELAVRDEGSGRHAIGTLDPVYANLGTASALVGLLQRVWRDEVSHPRATAELRRLMGLQVFVQRLTGELRADSLRLSGKAGTFLHLRHEIGVVEADSGDRVALAALTRADRRAGPGPDIDLAIGTAARQAFEALRG